MGNVLLTKDGPIATLRLSRGKVNAVNEELVDELSQCFEDLAGNDSVRAVVLTGTGAFFSFGFDIPELYNYTPEEFTRFLTKFTGLYRSMFLFPKPLVAAINGHAVAGGCMLSTACDHRIMVTGKAKISLNEITFGASVFQGGVELLRYWVGDRIAQDVLFSGAMYTAEEAVELGLVNEALDAEELDQRVAEVAAEYASKELPAFAHMKKMLRRPAVERMEKDEMNSINEFIDIWYSERLRKNLRKIEIRD